MKKLVMVGIVFFMLSGIACAGCGDYEYAELKEMDQKTLLKTFCDKLEYTGTVVMASIYNKSLEKEKRECISVTDKIERVYMKRFKIKDREMLLKMCL